MNYVHVLIIIRFVQTPSVEENRNWHVGSGELTPHIPAGEPHRWMPGPSFLSHMHQISGRFIFENQNVKGTKTTVPVHKFSSFTVLEPHIFCSTFLQNLSSSGSTPSMKLASQLSCVCCQLYWHLMNLTLWSKHYQQARHGSTHGLLLGGRARFLPLVSCFALHQKLQFTQRSGANTRLNCGSGWDHKKAPSTGLKKKKVNCCLSIVCLRTARCCDMLQTKSKLEKMQEGRRCWCGTCGWHFQRIPCDFYMQRDNQEAFWLGGTEAVTKKTQPVVVVSTVSTNTQPLLKKKKKREEQQRRSNLVWQAWERQWAYEILAMTATIP